MKKLLVIFSLSLAVSGYLICDTLFDAEAQLDLLWHWRMIFISIYTLTLLVAMPLKGEESEERHIGFTCYLGAGVISGDIVDKLMYNNSFGIADVILIIVMSYFGFKKSYPLTYKAVCKNLTK